MQLNKSKNKGKVHPSPITTTTTISSPNNSSIDPVSTLNNLLPQTILTLISILSLQDKQVLTYMITLNGKKSNTSNSTHKVPCFECACFDCYTSYWFKWDNSPHRELIHLAIEAFEEHLSLSEQVSKKSNRSGSKNSKHVLAGKPVCSSSTGGDDVDSEKGVVVVAAAAAAAAEEEEDILNDDNRGKEQVHFQQHKGLVRKVLPDVIGLFNSRLFNLWGPNV